MEALQKTFTKVILAEDGDLVVVVLHPTAVQKSIEFLVDSHALERSSSKWKDIVSAKQQGVVLLTSNPRHQKLFLSIMHDKLEALPKRVSEPALFELALLAQEYQVEHLIGPMVTSWSETPRDWLESISGPDIGSVLARIQKRLWVAWFFGERHLFSYFTHVLVRAVIVDDDKDLYVEGASLSAIREAHRIPTIPGLFDFISKEYHKRYQGLCDVIEKAANVKDRQFCKLHSRPDSEQFTCDATVVGSLLRGHKRHVLGPAKKSLQTPYEQLSEFPIYTYPTIVSDGIPDYIGRTHDGCNPRPRICYDLDLKFRGCVLLDKDMENHLKRQAQLTGMKCRNGQQRGERHVKDL
ncbi:hypothetical protein PG988_005867 [Apiospora saccharicola]